MSTHALKAPFPYFGGKSAIASEVWTRMGEVENFVEPFFGSGAVLLARPHKRGTETVNDLDANIANFWRAVQAEPDELARIMDWPVNEVDLEARHKWLVQSDSKREHRERMRNDPGYYDVKIAAWWCWGLCAWIGAGWCEGEWFGQDDERNVGTGTCNDAAKLPHLGNAGMGIHSHRSAILAWMRSLSDRLRRVRVCCGDWSRVMGRSVTYKLGLTGVFLDPPYSGENGRHNEIYAEEDLAVAHDVREWCIQNGDNPALRIALCGYEGEHEDLERHGWSVMAWKAHGGFGVQSQKEGSVEYTNNWRERIWFSPHCVGQRSMFGRAA